MRRFSLALTLAIGAVPASAQSFNIDFGPAGSQVPASSYGGAANQTGVWNQVGLGTLPLIATDGTSTSVGVGSQGIGVGSAYFSGASEGDHRLMRSFGFGQAFVSATYSVGGLSPGWYDFYVYAWSGMAPGFTESVVGWGESTSGSHGSIHTRFTDHWPGQQVRGETYEKFAVQVMNANGSIVFGLAPLGGELDPVSVINGLQIVQIPAPATLLLPALMPIARRRRG
jgi:hypothetical protein